MADLLQDRLQKESGLPVLVAYTYAEAKAIVESDVQVLVCITDLNLPDADEGATVPLLHSHHITTVVLTADYTMETRKKMYKEKVADFVIKDGVAALNYAVKTVVTLVENASNHIWVLSLASKNSKRLMGLLNIQRYKVSLFEDAGQLLNALQVKTPDLIMLNEAEQLPGFSSVKFIQELRAKYSQSQLPVIVSEENADMCEVIKLMKYGVNDFYNLGLTVEELYVRLQVHLSLALSYKKIERISRTDSLTGLFNRRYFFEMAAKLDAGSANVFAVMLDIDHFKVVNDSFGHVKGDDAIVFTAKTIQDVFKDHLIARFGGEEFCIFGKCENVSDIEALCETVRSRIEEHSVSVLGLPLTISIGLSVDHQSVEKLIIWADKALYESKDQGRNRITFLQ